MCPNECPRSGHIDVAPRGSASSGTGVRVMRSPSRKTPAPRSATQATSCSGCQIQARTVSPPLTSATITAWSGEPWTKFLVPSTGSTVKACSAATNRSRVVGSAEVRSSPSTNASG